MYMTTIVGLLIAALAAVVPRVGMGQQSQPEVNRWIKVSENQVGPRVAPALVWSKPLQRFVLVGGLVSHQVKEARPYDVQSFDLAARKWSNDLPAGAEGREVAADNVTDPGFDTPYYTMTDRDGAIRPHPNHALMGYQFAYAPWDECVYALVCGRTLRYDPKARAWTDREPTAGPAPLGRTYKESLNWGALCADPVNREIVLFGGCGVATETAGPGTWVYSTEQNRWRRLELDRQPPSRALSPLVYDPSTDKIVLFGGDGLDRLYADTWTYDCPTRTWENCQPRFSPSPRFGHALVQLPKSKRLLLIGGKGYTSSTSYLASLYQPLTFEMWTYDVAGKMWSLVTRVEEDAPPQPAVHPTLCAADDEDRLLLVTRQGRFQATTSTWVCQADASRVDEPGTAKFGVAPGTVEYRTGSYDPDWYHQDVPPVDEKATAAVLENLPANQWMALECPKWPQNRMGGGWSTVALDTDHDQILHLGGGHSSYFGNDVAHYDIATGRWSISYRPQFALDYNYDLSGPGPYAFNLGPWGNHNYHAYGYDATCGRLVYMREGTHLYNPVSRSWSVDEKFATPFEVSKYTTYVCPTPRGMAALTRTSRSNFVMGLYLLKEGKQWVQLPTSGDPLPLTETDGSTITYDSVRDQLIMTTTKSGQEAKSCGQVWTYRFDTGHVRAMNPAGMDAIQAARFAREAVYLPRLDLVMFGYHLGQPTVTPFYDAANNRWLTAEMPGSEFYARNTPGIGVSVDLGLAYDSKRDLVWGVMCKLTGTGALNVLRVDKSLKLSPVK
jgi:hypothetical protein